jgi:hypothetical protein
MILQLGKKCKRKHRTTRRGPSFEIQKENNVHTARLTRCPAANFVHLIADCSSDGTTWEGEKEN